MSQRAHHHAFSEDDVARAEAALDALGPSFRDWISDEIAKVQAARTAAENAGWRDEALAMLFEAAHDAKGLAATYGYPYVTRLAASLCRLIETPEGKTAARATPAFVIAHTDAMRAAVRDEIKTDDSASARVLIETLEARIDALCVAPR
ncbi:MAG: Hpt domain-containing protein [Alphaproteobacteria bacterium]|nr:Hpt domain-containing protein [Alphaproteobacteria bacterium]